jgi:hypothetical protein
VVHGGEPTRRVRNGGKPKFSRPGARRAAIGSSPMVRRVPEAQHVVHARDP